MDFKDIGLHWKWYSFDTVRYEGTIYLTGSRIYDSGAHTGLFSCQKSLVWYYSIPSPIPAIKAVITIIMYKVDMQHDCILNVLNL